MSFAVAHAHGSWSTTTGPTDCSAARHVLGLSAEIASSSERPGGWPMAEDSPAQPLPRRVSASDRHVPGGKQAPRAGPVRPVRQAVLSEDALRHMRNALDSVKAEAPPEMHALRAGGSASLPRRVPGAGKRPQPPAAIARPRLPSRADEAPTDEFPALSVSYPGANAEETTAQPDAQPEPGTTPPAELLQAPAPRPSAQQQLDGRDRTDRAIGLPEKPPGHQENGQDRRAKGPARRTKSLATRMKPPGLRTKAAGLRTKRSAATPSPAPTTRPSRAPKPARQKASASPGEPTQMAPLFPEELPPEQAILRPPTLTWPQRARWGSRITWLILALVLVSAGPLALLLSR